MNLLTTSRRDGLNANVTPDTVEQLDGIAKSIGVFEPTGNPDAFFETTSQQRAFNGLDDVEDVNLILLCWSPDMHSAFPDPQDVAGGMLKEIKAAVLNSVECDKGYPVNALNKCRPKKRIDLPTYVSLVCSQFMAVLRQLNRSQMDEHHRFSWIRPLVSHVTEGSQKTCENCDPAHNTQ
ncbi:hypothetical protein scyTo_0020155 [Scyliorhinus torazame]|uniref:Uncharacterized protein n=1 Tax=Scyliorhinus torazame TaxID=75743 RepID=A0A401Q0J8_SCYTO|nr:hypothetical protein [Scyliorhinus torazame]